MIDQITRAHSADSGETSRTISSFAETADVLSWMGCNLDPHASALAVGAEALLRVSTKKPARDQEQTSSNNAQTMADFLFNNTTFEWLKQRLDVMLSTDQGLDFTAVSRKMLGVLKQSHSWAKTREFCLAIDWNPCEFMRQSYANYVDISNVIAISTNGQTYEVCTVGEYMTRVWPVTGPQFLEVLKKWWRQVDEGREEEIFKCESTHLFQLLHH